MARRAPGTAIAASTTQSSASTNAQALAAARGGAAGGLWVTAGEQTAGRGRRGRAWTTGRGNLAASLLLIDPAPRGDWRRRSRSLRRWRCIRLPSIWPARQPPNVWRSSGRTTCSSIAQRSPASWSRARPSATARFAVVVGIGVNCVVASRRSPVAQPAGESRRRTAWRSTAEALFGRSRRPHGRGTRRMGPWSRLCRGAHGLAGPRRRRRRADPRQSRGQACSPAGSRRSTTTGGWCCCATTGGAQSVGAGDVFFGRREVGAMPRTPEDELVFLPLGGVGEIGMNLALYGFGPRHDRAWLAVDFGVSFAHADLPGVDLVFPDIAYLEEERINLLGIVITHAHEDHFGALVDLWPRLKVPVYATAFTANLLAAKIAAEPDAAAGAGQRRQGRRPHQARPVRGRIHQRRAFDPRSPMRSPSARRWAWSCTAATGRSTITPTVGLPTDARSPDGDRRRGCAGAASAIRPMRMREGRSPSESGGRRRELAEIIRSAARPSRGLHDLRVQCRPHRSRSRGRARGGGRDVVVVGPRHAPGHRCRRRTRHAGRHAAVPRPRRRTPTCRATRWSCCSPAARASRARRWPASPLTTTRASSWPRAISSFSRRAPSPATSTTINRIINALTERGIRVITDQRAAGPRLRPSAPRRDAPDVWLAEAAHRDSRPRRAACTLPRMPIWRASLASRPWSKIEDGIMTRLAPGPGRPDRRDRAGQLYKDGRLIGRPGGHRRGRAAAAVASRPRHGIHRDRRARRDGRRAADRS